VTGVPNARLAAEVRTLEWLALADEPATAGALREALDPVRQAAVQPEDLWTVAAEAGCDLALSYSWAQGPGAMDAVFRPRTSSSRLAFPRMADAGPIKPWSEYATNPLKARLVRDLVPRLRSAMQEKVPDYMVPSHFVVLDALPLSPNGKVDRRGLPEPEGRRQVDAAYVAPRTETECKVAAMWREVLHLDKVGTRDDFFELGGHSLLATQVVSRIRDAFAVEVRLASLFEEPTIAALARLIEHAASGGVGRKTSPIARVSRVRRTLRAHPEGSGT
jgi:acyl carrier protein